MIGTLSPSYGRDYKSKKQLLEDFNNNKDFVNNTPTGTNYINKEDIINSGVTTVTIRYGKLTKVTVVKYNKNKQQWV